jgi:hypothetical protein
MLAGRPQEAAGNGSPRWMTVAPRKRGHRTRPTGRLTPFRRLYVTGQQVLAQILTLQPPDPAAALLGALDVNRWEVRRRLEAVTPDS